MMDIDPAYRKDTMHPARWGYQARGNVAPSSIIIHTTNNRRKNTSFAKEAEYLRDSAAVSAHFLIGRDGRITQFLDPVRWQAWHAGDTTPAFLNAKSIGVEHHVSVGETWTDAQHEACTWLVQGLMAAHRIPPELVDTHRAVALPKKRKSDPEGWDDASFYAWRATLASLAPIDLFFQWGPIGKPTGAAQSFAVPKAWLMNKKLGKCVAPETYSLSGKYSITEFAAGIITYLKARNTTIVEMFS